eukprot:TRINITY_DN29865_c0_g1_i1.p1 TRINITY_DN29865_c0_g1~~TRINITY_DN29865_c0_g1_i1.p1  ORF type:complete len:1608 (+),score=561.90 TRINITY_DN29865_c0_g1_i1:63-4826(+)
MDLRPPPREVPSRRGTAELKPAPPSVRLSVASATPKQTRSPRVSFTGDKERSPSVRRRQGSAAVQKEPQPPQPLQPPKEQSPPSPTQPGDDMLAAIQRTQSKRPGRRPETVSWDDVPLSQLREAFRGEGDGEYHPMAMDEFVTRFGGMLRRSTRELRMMFMRIDANANGTVDWDEFSNFLLLNQAIASREGKPSVEPDSSYDEDYREGDAEAIAAQGKFVDHTDTVTRILVHPRYPRYVTAGQDGTVKYWHSTSLTHERTIHNGTVWVSDLLYTPPHAPSPNDHIIVASLDRVISVYEGNSGELVKSFKGKKRRRDRRREIVMREDFSLPARPHLTEGQVNGLRLPGQEQQGTHSTLLSHFKKKRPIEMVLLEHLETIPWALGQYAHGGQERLLIGTDDSGMHPGGARIYMYNLSEPTWDKVSIKCLNSGGGAVGWPTGHKGGVTRLVVADRMESVITSGQDGTIRILHLERGTNQRVLGCGYDVDAHVGRVSPQHRLGGLGLAGVIPADNADVAGDSGHRKPVRTFAWCDDRKLIASCGTERDVLVWNPFITKPVSKLVGHRTSMVDVVFNPHDYQVITLSSDKVVKIWDVRTYQCVQTLRDKSRYRPEDRLGALAYDWRRSAIVTASCRPHVRPMTRNFSEFPPNYHGHRRGVIGACLSTTFRQLATADETKVCVWDLDSLSAVVSWEVPQGVTALCFDSNERRLLTGTRTGDVLVWNYVTAQLLKTCQGRVSVVVGDDRRKRKVAVPKGRRGRDEVSVVFFAAHVIRSRGTGLTRLVGSVQDHRHILLYEDSDDLDEPYFRRIEVPPGDAFNGIYSLLCPTTCSVVVMGTGMGGLALSPLDIVGPSRPALLPTLPGDARNRWCGVLDGALHGGVMQCVRADDAPVTLHPVDCIVEQIVWLSQSPRVLITARGDGCISFWDCDMQAMEGGGEQFGFQATHERGEAVYVLALDTEQRRLFSGDVAGYINTYDISAVHGDAPDWPRAVRKIHGFRAHKRGVTQLKHLSSPGDLLLSAASDCVVQFVTPTGMVAARVGETGPQPGLRPNALGDPSQWQRNPLPHSAPAHRVLQLYRKMDLLRALVRRAGDAGLTLRAAARTAQEMTGGSFLTCDGADWTGASQRGREEAAEEVARSLLAQLSAPTAAGQQLVLSDYIAGDLCYRVDLQRLAQLGGVEQQYPPPPPPVSTGFLVPDGAAGRQPTDADGDRGAAGAGDSDDGASDSSLAGRPAAVDCISAGRRLLQPLADGSRRRQRAGDLSPRRPQRGRGAGNPLVRDGASPPRGGESSSDASRSPPRRPTSPLSADGSPAREDTPVTPPPPAAHAPRRPLRTLLPIPELRPTRCRQVQTARGPGFDWETCGRRDWTARWLLSPRAATRGGGESADDDDSGSIFWRTEPPPRARRPTCISVDQSETRRLGVAGPAEPDESADARSEAPAADSPVRKDRLFADRGAGLTARSSVADDSSRVQRADEGRGRSVSTFVEEGRGRTAADRPPQAPASSRTAGAGVDADGDAALAAEMRQWFLKARREHAPTKRRHRKYDVGSVPLRAHTCISLTKPQQIVPPRKSHRHPHSIVSGPTPAPPLR